VCFGVVATHPTNEGVSNDDTVVVVWVVFSRSVCDGGSCCGRVVRRSSDPPIKMGRQELEKMNGENAERLEKLTQSKV
jgi:hypothetical protein